MNLKTKYNNPVVINSFLELPYSYFLKNEEAYSMGDLLFLKIDYGTNDRDYYVILVEDSKYYFIESIDPSLYSREYFLNSLERIYNNHLNGKYLFKKELFVEFKT